MQNIWFFDPVSGNISESDTASQPDMTQEQLVDIVGYTEAFTFNDHVALNHGNFHNMNPQIKNINPNDDERKYLTSHTASNINSNCVHPAIYMGGGGLSLNELAQMVMAPQNWKELIDRALSNDFIHQSLNIFRRCNEAEQDVELKFVSFVAPFSHRLNRPCFGTIGVQFGVAGLLTVPNVAVTGKSDNQYLTLNENRRFITEVKTARTFPLRELWYHRSRAVQSVAAMYYSGLPMLLVSPCSYKLIVENSDRTQIFRFPSETPVAVESGDTASMDFLYVVGILILSTREALSQTPPISSNNLITVKNETEESTPMKKFQQTKSSRLDRAAKKKRKYTEENSSSEIGYNINNRQIWFMSPDEIERAFGMNNEFPVATTSTVIENALLSQELINQDIVKVVSDERETND